MDSMTFRTSQLPLTEGMLCLGMELLAEEVKLPRELEVRHPDTPGGMAIAAGQRGTRWAL